MLKYYGITALTKHYGEVFCDTKVFVDDWKEVDRLRTVEEMYIPEQCDSFDSPSH